MKPSSKDFERRLLGRISSDTKGAGGPDIEMIGLWQKPAIAR